MDLLSWWLTAMLMLIGLLGTVVPLVPGTILILVAAFYHRWYFGPTESVGWITLGALVFLTLLSQAIDFLSSAAGAKYFGATRWGVIGGLAGGIVGLFFGLPGLIIGPLVGVLAGELLGGQRLLPATRSTWGTVIGTGVGMIAKVAIAAVMVGWFLLALVS